MPCRPAEYDLRRKDGEKAEAEVTEAIRERHELRHVLLDYATDPDLELTQPLASELGRFVSEKPEPLQPRPEDANPERYPNPVQGSWALELLYRADREQKKLCEGRTIMVRLAEIRPPSPSVMKKFSAQLQAHRRHRQEDLDAVCSALRDRINYLQRQKGPGHPEVAPLRVRLEQALALTVDDILADRDLLKSFWP